MSKNVKVAGTSYNGVPAILLPLATGSGTAKFTDTSASTVTAERIISGYGAYDSTGTWVDGTSSGEDIIIEDVWTISGDTLYIDDGSGGAYNISSVDNGNGTQNLVITDASGGGGGASATQHVIHLEFSDSTDTDINVYYDNSLIGTMITAYTPTTYNNKTVTLAQLDNVTWYSPTNIPLNTQLIDFSAVTSGYVVDSSTGAETASQWSCVSDYTLIDPSMTFSYIGYQWYGIAFYDTSKTFISSIARMDTDADSIDGDYAHGTLTPAKIPSNAVYVRINSYPNNADNTMLSLIRTA